MIAPDSSIVTSLMFHSVGLQDTNWFWAGLSESTATFEDKLKVLSDRGFTTVFWSEVYDHVADQRRLPRTSVMLTFDDGYLDNWVLVTPLLRKYGAKATIFVSSDFVQPDGPVRSTLEDVWSGAVDAAELSLAGFLRPSEMRAMVESGLVEIQSHASTHTWYFTSNRLVDVYDPRKYKKYPWMAWNAAPERKPFYLSEDQASLVSVGEPIFEHDKSLVARRFTADQGAVEDFKRVWSREGYAPADQSTQLTRARAIERGLKLENGWPGQYESEDERVMRIRAELMRNRELLTSITNRSPEFLAWPGGAYDEVGVGIALACGFKAYTLGSRDKRWRRNRPGEDPRGLKRITSSSRLFVRGVYCGVQGGYYQYLLIRAHQKSMVHIIALYAYKAREYIRTLLVGLRR